MVIRFTSTLTADDEARVAPALLRAVGNLLAPFPILYSIRIETTAGDIVEDGGAGAKSDLWLASGSHARRGGNERGKAPNSQR
jgi:hypothetical protein